MEPIFEVQSKVLRLFLLPGCKLLWVTFTFLEGQKLGDQIILMHSLLNFLGIFVGCAHEAFQGSLLQFPEFDTEFDISCLFKLEACRKTVNLSKHIVKKMHVTVPVVNSITSRGFLTHEIPESYFSLLLHTHDCVVHHSLSTGTVSKPFEYTSLHNIQHSLAMCSN